MVVSPVRVAARTAQRLSNGLLDQRMEVTGEDDLAALAASFNQMAENLQRHILRLEDMSRLQRRFTSDVSHELRTPLTTVRMAADLIFNTRDEFEPAVARSAELLQTGWCTPRSGSAAQRKNKHRFVAADGAKLEKLNSRLGVFP